MISRILTKTCRQIAPTAKAARAVRGMVPAEGLGATVEDWAVRMGMSANHLRACGRACGVPVSESLHRVRALRALSLYRPPEERWVRVAHRAQFASDASLARSLRSAVGKSPSAVAHDGLELWIGRFLGWLEDQRSAGAGRRSGNP